MELWVRSQDKEDLIKAYNFRILNESNIAINVKTNGSSLEYLVVGKYLTKERAVQVLDEIQNMLKPRLIIKDSGKIIGTFEDTIIREGANYELKELPTYVYEMPEE